MKSNPKRNENFNLLRENVIFTLFRIWCPKELRETKIYKYGLEEEINNVEKYRT